MAIETIGPEWTIPGLVVGSTTRRGGVSDGAFATANLGLSGDAAERVRENRRRLEAQVGSRLHWLRQCHGVDVARCTPEGRGPATVADAAISRPGDAGAVVLTADCLPIVLAAGDGSVAAVVHAGWRGLAAGIIERTCAEIEATSQLCAWLGPAISAAAFEVGQDVLDAFCKEDSDAGAFFEVNARGRWQADLYGLARMRLNRLGIDRISGGDRCTFSHPEVFFSYRRDGLTGRMATFACYPQAIDLDQ